MLDSEIRIFYSLSTHSQSQGDHNGSQSKSSASKDPEEQFPVLKTSQGWYDIHSCFQCPYKAYAKVGPVCVCVCVCVCLSAKIIYISHVCFHSMTI